MHNVLINLTISASFVFFDVTLWFFNVTFSGLRSLDCIFLNQFPWRLQPAVVIKPQTTN